MGNISAQGIQRLLGTPTLDRLQTVIRESVQNSWDAALRRRRPHYRVHLRQLSSRQMSVLRDRFFVDLVEEDAPECLSNFLQKDRPYVLELSDFGTSGLGGPTDASVITSDDDDTDFVDFVRNIGTPRDTAQGGGTYGYGKSSLYAISRCQTVIIDTLARFDGREERRLIGSRIASSFVVSRGKHKGKYTGRHWWGRAAGSGGRLNPLTGAGAQRLSEVLGLAERGTGEFGTSIAILDPDLDQAPEALMNAIQRSLLWNFWPKMVAHGRRGQAMKFQTLMNGEEYPLPGLDECPPLDVFAAAYRDLKNGDSTAIHCGNPRKHLGEISMHSEPKGERLPGFTPTEDEMFPEPSCHVALMRPAELVVKYVQGNQAPPGYEWGGLFVCSDDDEVEQAFAESEPPAHDDWIPKHMPRGRQKTFVNTALRRIREQMDAKFATRGINLEGGSAQLARASGRMGALLSGALGDGLQKRQPGRRKGSGSKRHRSLRIVRLEAWGPAETMDDEVLAWFTFEIESPQPREVTVSGRPRIFIDGEFSDEGPDGEVPEIRLWADSNDRLLAEGTELTISTEQRGYIQVGVSMPGGLPVGFTPEILES